MSKLLDALADTVLMVAPVNFCFNADAAKTNTFMNAPSSLASLASLSSHPLSSANDTSSASDSTVLSPEQRAKVQALARHEFDHFSRTLVAAGVRVDVIEDLPDPPTPDSIFPNNWLSTHRDGALVLYPMEPPSRRAERRPHIIAHLQTAYGFGRIIDLSGLEQRQVYVEGTGSLVLDRARHIAYACYSPRTCPAALAEFAAKVHCQSVPTSSTTTAATTSAPFTMVLFNALRRDGSKIYHTNVMLSVGSGTAVVCSEVVRDAKERQALLASLRAHGDVVVEISEAQMDKFAGNMLQLKRARTSGGVGASDGGASAASKETGATTAAPAPSAVPAAAPAQPAHEHRKDKVWVMSSQAFHSLSSDQVSILTRDADIVHAPLPTIEAIGGGSARCMLAEIFTPSGSG